MFGFIKRLNTNPFLFISISLIAIIILGFSLNIILLKKPTMSGELSKDYHLNKGYSTSNWSPKLFDYLNLNYPSNVMILPLYDEFKNVTGVVLYGDGTARVTSPTLEQINFSAEKVFVPLERQTLDLLLLNLDAIEVELPAIVDEHIHTFMNNQSQLFYSLRLFDYMRLYPPLEEERMALIEGPAQTIYSYYETQNVRLESGGRTLVSFQHPLLTTQYPTPNVMKWGLIIVLILLAISFSLTGILTFDSHQKRVWETIMREVEHIPHIYSILLMALYLMSDWLLGAEPFTFQFVYGIKIALLFLLIYPYSQSRKGWAYLGIQSEHYGKDLFAAITLGFLIQIIATQDLPVNMIRFSWIELFSFIKLFFFVIFVQELFWRSLFQNALERLTHRWISLGITTTAMTIFYAGLPIWGISSIQNQLELFMIIPFTYLLIGYFYQRTRNIIATTLLSTLLKVLPLWLIYY